MGNFFPECSHCDVRNGEDCAGSGLVRCLHPPAGTLRHGAADHFPTLLTIVNRKEGGEFHIIIVDNGRGDILACPDLSGTLNCIRCGECMNTCPVYRRSGGYSYTYFIPGPIGINLGMLKRSGEIFGQCFCLFVVPLFARMFARSR